MFVYILTNRNHTVLYVGVTNDILTRLWEHQQSRNGFVRRYQLTKLVYIEGFESAIRAIRREKYIKGKGTFWKVSLVNTINPFWLDLTMSLKQY